MPSGSKCSQPNSRVLQTATIEHQPPPKEYGEEDVEEEPKESLGLLYVNLGGFNTLVLIVHEHIRRLTKQELRHAHKGK